MSISWTTALPVVAIIGMKFAHDLSPLFPFTPMKQLRLLLLFVVCSVQTWAATLAVDSTVRLKASHADGVPVRNAKADTSYFRWPDQTEATVVQDDGNWVQIAASGRKVWVLEKYLELVEKSVADADEDTETEIPTLTVGAWNLEHLHDGAPRGFPEFQGRNALPARTEDDLARVADAIRSRLRVGVLMLSEIAGIPGTQKSSELDRLCRFAGPSWAYIIGTTGGRNGTQRVAIMYDMNRVTLISSWELVIPRADVQGEDVFNRDPLVGYFRANLTSGKGTDFLAVALHLASGQQNAANHNQAMTVLQQEIKTLLTTKPELSGEKDVVLGGDLNASRYDKYSETFWTSYDAASPSNPNGLSYVTLAAPDAEDYKPTRVKGNPPFPGSYIDYLIGSASFTNRITLPTATVHHELALEGDFYRYRVDFSDHFPVTVALKIGADDDGRN